MKFKSKIFGKLFFAACYAAATMQVAHAEDIEIFFAPTSSTANIKPNVVFAIDTSGSMTGKINGERKIDIVKDVMNQLLTDVKDVNAGLMRFNAGTSGGWDSAYGGPVLFPALDVDLPANPVVFKEIDEGSDDSFENVATVVDLNSNSLQIDGTLSKYTALRFTNLNIPQGANIDNASISFSAYGDSSGSAKFEIVGHLVDDAPELTNTAADISNRLVTQQTSAVEVWEPGDWTNGQSYVTGDVSSVVQEIVNLSGWCGGNDLVLILKGTDGASRVAYSAEGEEAVGGGSDDTDAFTAPRIKVEYDNTLPSGANGCYASEVSVRVDRGSDDAEEVGGSGSGDLDFDQTGSSRNDKIAVSFRGINVPRNAVISSAYIDLSADRYNTGAASATIYGVNDGTPAMGYSAIGLGSGALTSGITWNFEDPWISNQTFTSPDIASIIQTLVNRTDWNSGNNMSFRLDPQSGYREAESYEGDNDQAAVLRISFRGTYTPGAITIREDLKATIQDLNATGYTPITDTIAEAGQYFTGGKVTFGISRDGNRYNRMSNELSYNGLGFPYTPSGCNDSNPNASACAGERIIGSPNYVSPITESCQSSHFVFLTDGAPTSHHSETEDIYKAWTGSNCTSTDRYRDCAIAIAGYMHNNDVSPSLAGKQTVTTHMIGFGSGADPQLMKDMADAGGGGHYSADDKDELVAALTQIVASIANVNTTFVSTGVTVNQFNRLTHNEELYYSLFSPQSGAVWPGNIKRYRLNSGVVVDVNGNPAVDVLSSEFKGDSRSWWSDETDGNKVEDGGAASQLTVARTIYSNLSSNDLTASENVFNETNVTQAMLGASSDVDRKNIIHWALGYDVDHENYDVNNLSTTPAHHQFGDPLHSQPTVISYQSASPSKNKAVVFVGTNHGYLHAINTDATSGEELWAFIPNELLPMLSDLQKDSLGNHKYGLDGSIAVYIDDTNNNGAIDVDDGEKAYLYVGMRRGGSSYYALDISDPDQPNLLFSIEPTRSGYGNLGQSWSRPIIGKMDIGSVNSDKLVMMFGGGYDTTQDLAGTSSATDSVGKGVYIADAYTGNLLWHSSSATQAAAPAGPISSMNSVPATLAAFDLDDDKLIDHFYAADTKAQLFRFDVDNSNGTITGGRIANLQSAADVANNRRFYAAPDAALIRLQEESFISISIGSGYRAHPLDENVTDYFYMIKDKGVLSKNFDMDVELSDLANVTSLIGDADNNGTSDALEVINSDTNPTPGWYISFSDTGEKVIEKSITFNNAVFFTTYVPPGSSTNVCEAAAGGAKFYGMKIVDGNPYVDTNYDGSLTEVDRSFKLAGSGIAPPPQVLITPTGPTICVGIQCGGQLEDFPPPLPRGLTGIRWRKD